MDFGGRRRHAPARARDGGRGEELRTRPGSCQFLATFRQNVARFRLYRSRSLQANTRFAAFFKIYLDVLAEFFEIWQNFANLQHNDLQKLC